MLKIMPKYTNDKKARLSNIQKQVLKSNTFVSEVKTKTLNIIIGNFLQWGNNFTNYKRFTYLT